MNLKLLIFCSCLLIFAFITRYILDLPFYISLMIFLVLCLVLLCALIRKVFYLCIFPGSNWWFKRSLELTYCREMSAQIFTKMEQLSEYLVAVRSNNFTSQVSYDHNSKKLINTLAENYENIKNISRRQKCILNLILNLRIQLEHIIVAVDEEEISLWNWIEMRLESDKSTCIYISNLIQEQRFKSALDNLNRIKSILLNNVANKNSLEKCAAYLFNDSIGTLDYMRSDLCQRFHCEEYNIECNNATINCIYVICGEVSHSSVIICNPNAGFYEFTYFQSEWLEFYTTRDINVILWNYRGYGRSKGSPSVSQIVEDGKAVLKFFKNIKCINKLAIHGESLGGCIGILLAEAIGCDILLADRTFGCLSDMILFGYGRFAYFLYKLLRIEDIETASIYLKLSCNKIISSDPHDSIIPNVASLKTAVAANFLLKRRVIIGEYYISQKWQKDSYVLSPIDLIRLAESLEHTYLMLASSENEMTGKNKLEIKTEGNEEMERKEFLKKVANALKSVDACGVMLIDIIKPHITQFNLKLWMMTLEVWGSYFGSFINTDSDPMHKCLKDLKHCIYELEGIDDFLLSPNLQIVSSLLKKVLEHLQETASRPAVSFRTEDNLFTNEYSKAGAFMWIECGHGGQYSQFERCNYENHLNRVNFL